MNRIGSRCFSLRCLTKITDSKENVIRHKGSEFTVDEDRFFEIRETSGEKFKEYFLITEIKTK